MSSITIDTSEITALANRMEGAPRIIQAELTEAMREGTQLVTQRARQIAPKGKTKELSRRITPEVRVLGLNVEGIVTAQARHSRWIEEGRGPVVARRAKALRFEVGGQVLFRKSVGPAAAQPFMRPALRQSELQIRTAFRDATRRAIARLLGGG